MTDRELLELAAKAVGIKIDKSPYNGGGHGNTGFDVMGNAVLDWHKGKTWNPLKDDGNALRLAVKLKLDLHYEYNGSVLGNIVEAMSPEREDGSRLCISENTDADPRAATRRAIVRAAAEIGVAK